MIEINADAMTADIAALIGRFRALPRHIARKHMAAAMKRAMRPGVPMLKRNTPKARVARLIYGTSITQSKPGTLRRSVATKAKAVPGRSGAGVAYGILGFRSVGQNRNAIWQEFGTKRGVRPKGMVAKTMQQIRGPAAATLTRELAVALEKAAAELASGKNPTRSYR